MAVDVAALFVRPDSVYKGLPGVDCYDADRDARTWPGGVPVVAHPPCRAWGQLRQFAKPRPDERELAPWAVSMARQFGGVVEHPLRSQLWRAVGCASPGIRDRFGGVLLTVHQSWWGHRAQKASGLYFVGADVPALPFDLVPGVVPVERMCRAEREHTPAALAAWLVAVARSSGVTRLGVAA